MASSPHRRIRRRRKAMALAATGASAALLLGGIAAPDANAFILEGPAACAPGGSGSALVPPSEADCTDAQVSIIGTIGDQIIALVAPDLGIKLSELNGAGVLLGGNATIKGSGFNTAITILGGDSVASSDYYASGAIAIAAVGGKANADALFGGALALGVAGTANAQALPLGVAIANSLLTGSTAEATALGGIASATSTATDKDVVCTALYGTASLAGPDGKSQGSCTSVLFIFQKYEEGDGEPTWYAIKNPLDVSLMSPFGDGFAELLSGIGGALGLPDGTADLLAGKFVPKFGSDLVRISFDGGTPKVESDLPDFLGNLLDQSSASTPPLGLRDLGLDKGDVQSVSGYGIGGGEAGAGGDANTDDLQVSDDSGSADKSAPAGTVAPVDNSEAPADQSPAGDVGASPTGEVDSSSSGDVGSSPVGSDQGGDADVELEPAL